MVSHLGKFTCIERDINPSRVEQEEMADACMDLLAGEISDRDFIDHHLLRSLFPNPDEIGNICLNKFVGRQTASSPYTHFTGSDEDLIRIVKEAMTNNQATRG